MHGKHCEILLFDGAGKIARRKEKCAVRPMNDSWSRTSKALKAAIAAGSEFVVMCCAGRFESLPFDGAGKIARRKEKRRRPANERLLVMYLTGIETGYHCRL